MSETGAGDVRIEMRTRLEPPDVAAVLDLATAATRADGHRPLSEQAELHLRRGGGEPVRQVLARGPDGWVVGYAQVDPADEAEGAAAELVVAPGARRRGLGRLLLRAAESAAGDGRLRVWAHGDSAAAAALAASAGYERIRSLWLMRRALSADLPELRVPAGVRLRPFRTGSDEQAWLAVNARAFADHPEQGSMTRRDLDARMAEPWFDPAGFLLAVDAAQGDLLGFHWTKVHTDAEEPVGEVYVVGVDPAARGRGLGSVLTLAGLHHLRERGLGAAILYVESDNTGALRVYRGLGFERVSTDVMYRRPPGSR